LAHAYTPGLKVREIAHVVKKRILPLKGEVLVEEGQRVDSELVVARTLLPGPVEPVNVANKLGLPPEDVRECMMKLEGDSIDKDEPLAMSKGIFGLFKSVCKSPVKGQVENISDITGQIMLRQDAVPVEVKAYIDGTISQVIPGEGVTVETQGTFIQGIFGIGGEVSGPLHMVAESPDTVLEDGMISGDHRGKIIVGGSRVTSAAVAGAIEVGAAGVIAGGFDDRDLRDFLGYDLGVAITGSETKGITLIITEGFGKIDMAHATFELLKKREGKKACINGATQIRAGVIRPEVIVPLEGEVSKAAGGPAEVEGTALVVGTRIRAIRQPYFGMLGNVTALPPQLQVLESEANVRVLGVKFDDGAEAIVPRANVEVIES
jgi:hypothetical protein